MNKEKLSLDHVTLLYGKLKDMDTDISEYTFANLYLFRDVHQYEVIMNSEILIKGVAYDGTPYVMPIFDLQKADRAFLNDLIREHGTLFPIDEEWLKIFDPDIYDFEFLDGDMDYVYTTQKISTYQGKKLHSKRNLLYQFYDTHSHQEYPLLKGRRDDAFRILDMWQDEMGISGKDTDYYPCREAILLQDELILCGGIYYADKEPAGFILGEEINPSMFALHFAKGLRKFKGIYQFMYNNCARVLGTHYEYVNFEQDLGKLPLRQAKSSYIPDKMIRKYRVRLRK